MLFVKTCWAGKQAGEEKGRGNFHLFLRGPNFRWFGILDTEYEWVGKGSRFWYMALHLTRSHA
jgi:hypothetical protein